MWGHGKIKTVVLKVGLGVFLNLKEELYNFKHYMYMKQHSFN